MKSNRRLANSGQAVNEDLARSVLPQQLPNRIDAIYISEYIVRNYVPKTERAMQLGNSDLIEPRICGSWVEILLDLPCLGTSNSVLSRAVTALAVSMPSQLNVAHVDRAYSYQTAVRRLRTELSVRNKKLPLELIPTVMCLTLLEVCGSQTRVPTFVRLLIIS
jgi:hypothetical protein